jgi:hypothetical protein
MHTLYTLLVASKQLKLLGLRVSTHLSCNIAKEAMTVSNQLKKISDFLP